VVGRARQVRLGPLGRALGAIEDEPVPAWDERSHLTGPAERTLVYLLVLDTINFSFWRPPGATGAKVGYRELARALREIFERGDELASPEALAGLDRRRFVDLLGPLPMADERVAALQELGAHGFSGLVEPTAAGTAQALSRGLRSYADVATYDGHSIPFLKRAQILPADLHAAGVRQFADLDALTCFADYKLPQLLRHWGALELSPGLARRVDAELPLQAGEAAETELRASTVTAVERLRAALAERGRQLLSIEVDWILWEAAQRLPGLHPYPRVRTIFY
jgi:hypothetical protein